MKGRGAAESSEIDCVGKAASLKAPMGTEAAEGLTRVGGRRPEEGPGRRKKKRNLRTSGALGKKGI